ncbi:Mobile element protein [Candidatus Enterovibrio altilux]|uniref:Mobile element protein n=1 Tax=Candidatus Enterovibrio altilux TaxID=1927128 RepID=A0A291B708_9GAMM|nr:Mobile element protein [Candidatus Enterovibrio luxaltus]
MNNLRYQIINWKEYNQALINCGSLMLWLDEEAIQLWNQTKKVNDYGRPHLFSDLAIASELSTSHVTDDEVLLSLLKQTH